MILFSLSKVILSDPTLSGWAGKTLMLPQGGLHHPPTANPSPLPFCALVLAPLRRNSPFRRSSLDSPFRGIDTEGLCAPYGAGLEGNEGQVEIGRASCRERV